MLQVEIVSKETAYFTKSYLGERLDFKMAFIFF